MGTRMLTLRLEISRFLPNNSRFREKVRAFVHQQKKIIQRYYEYEMNNKSIK